MKLIKKDKFNKEIKGNFEYPFEVSKNSLYLIEIIASAESWWQKLIKFKSFFQDDDLAVKLDGINFSKSSKDSLLRQLFGRNENEAGEAIWNGNNLKRLFKTNLIIARLNKGKHSLSFLADQEPFLKSIKIFEADGDGINYVPEENNPSEGGNCRQWITIILVDSPLKKLYLKASADKKELFDDDDIKLIIDGNIETNNDEKSHKYWYWCGRTLKGAEKEFSKELNFEKGLHYIELWADKTPVLKELIIKMGDFDNKEAPDGIIEQIQDLYGEIGQTVEFSKIPVPVENFNKYDEEIKVASAEFDVEPTILKATIAQESSFGNVIDHDYRYIGESGLMGLEKKNSIAQLKKIGYSFDYGNVQDVIRASAAYFKWLTGIELENFKDTRNPLKLYTQYSKDLKARSTKAPGIKEFLYYYFYYKQQ